MTAVAHHGTPSTTRQRSTGKSRGLGIILLLNAVLGGMLLTFLRQFPLPLLTDDTRRKGGAGPHGGRAHASDALLPAPAGSGRGLTVHVFASDTGSWRAVEPVAKQAAKDGATVKVCLSGAAARQRGSARADSSGQAPALEFVGEGEAAVRRLAGERHDITLLGLSTSHAGAAEGALVLCLTAASAAVGLIEDRPATALPTLEFARSSCAHRADGRLDEGPVLCVHDEVAEGLVREHTSFRGRIVATGGPQYDLTVQRGILGTPAAAEERARLRRLLRLPQDAIAVLAVGQPGGAAELARLIVAGVPPELTHRVRILFRPHPRADPADAAAAAEALRAAPAALLDYDQAAMARLPSAEEAVAAVEAVVSGFSTVNTHAILRGVRGVIYAATPTLAEQYRRTKKLEVPPEVARGAAWRVERAEELAGVLRALAEGEASAEVRRVAAAQAQLREVHRGGAAERAWRAVLGAALQRRPARVTRAGGAGGNKRGEAGDTQGASSGGTATAAADEGPGLPPHAAIRDGAAGADSSAAAVTARVEAAGAEAMRTGVVTSSSSRR